MVIAQAKRKGICEKLAMVLPASLSTDHVSGSTIKVVPSVSFTFGKQPYSSSSSKPITSPKLPLM